MGTREYIETILKLGLSEAQKGYYDKMLSDLIDIEVVPIKEVLTDSEIAFVKKYLNPQMKECFKNAHLFTAALRSECEYDLDKVYHITNQTGVYGGIYQHDYRYGRK